MGTGLSLCEEVGREVGRDVGREVGREKFIGLEGGDDLGGRGDELQPTAVAVSEVVACGGELEMGESGRNGPSRASAGDSGRLPGIVARPVRVNGGEE